MGESQGEGISFVHLFFPGDRLPGTSPGHFRDSLHAALLVGKHCRRPGQVTFEFRFSTPGHWLECFQVGGGHVATQETRTVDNLQDEVNIGAQAADLVLVEGAMQALDGGSTILAPDNDLG